MICIIIVILTWFLIFYIFVWNERYNGRHTRISAEHATSGSANLISVLCRA